MKKQYNPTYESNTFLGTVVLDAKENKKIQIDYPIYYHHFVKKICNVGDKIAMIITNKRPKRSLAQNAFSHVYYGLIALSSGNTMEAIKAWAKEQCLYEGITEVFGEEVKIIKETSKLNMSQFCEFMNRLQDISGVPIPDPRPFGLALTLDEFGRLRKKQQETYKALRVTIKV